MDDYCVRNSCLLYEGSCGYRNILSKDNCQGKVLSSRCASAHNIYGIASTIAFKAIKLSGQNIDAVSALKE